MAYLLAAIPSPFFFKKMVKRGYLLNLLDEKVILN